MMAGFDIPIRALRQQISSAVQIIVQSRRVTGGRRKVVSVSEITGMEGQVIQMGKTVAFLEARLTDSEGTLVAKATSSARLVPTSRLPP